MRNLSVGGCRLACGAFGSLGFALCHGHVTSLGPYQNRWARTGQLGGEVCRARVVHAYMVLEVCCMNQALHYPWASLAVSAPVPFPGYLGARNRTSVLLLWSIHSNGEAEGECIPRSPLYGNLRPIKSDCLGVGLQGRGSVYSSGFRVIVSLPCVYPSTLSVLFS